MLIAIRVDASAKIGLGHLMRCMTLANHLVQFGAKVLFVCRDLSDVFSKLISENGHEVVHLNRSSDSSFSQQKAHADRSNDELLPQHANWLDVSWDADAADCIERLAICGQIDWLIVDHYALDKRWESAMRSIAKKIMVIDDLADRQHDCDILLDQNYYVDQEVRYQALIAATTHLMLGPHYALLRPEFSIVKNDEERSNRFLMKPKRINICFGGVDANGDSFKALEAVTSLLNDYDLQVDVILGRASPHVAHIGEWIKKYKQVELHVAPTNMAELMASADIAIGAAGSMSWERASLGVPSIAVAIAENQFKVGQDAATVGMHLFLGRASEINVAQIKTAILVLLENSCLRELFVNRSLAMCDAQGASKIARHLIDNKINIRRCTLDDCENLYQWRNAEENRYNSHDSKIIPYESHQRWVGSVTVSDEHFLLIGSDAEGPVGVLRYDFNVKSNFWMTSIYLVPGRHGKGLGKDLLIAGLDWLKSSGKQVSEIRAEIKTENKASHSVFLRAGYTPLFTTYKVNQEFYD